jgi:tetratricopeptide (TPR) repeat protein
MLAFETVFATMSSIGADAVIERANALLAIDPDFTPAYNMLGYAYMDKEDFENAGKVLQEQIRSVPGLANPYDSMGDYYLAVGDNELALKYFEQSASMGLTASTTKADSLKSIPETEEE